MFYQRVFIALANRSVKYAVVGGLAVNLYGVPRMTADIDLVVDLEPENLKSFLHVMDELGFRPRLPVRAEELLKKNVRDSWVKEKNLHAFTFWSEANPAQEIDLLLSGSDDCGIIERAKLLKVGEIDISLVSIDDLLAMKAQVKRRQDIADVEALQELKKMEGQ